jgi:hypothetical protein
MPEWKLECFRVSGEPASNESEEEVSRRDRVEKAMNDAAGLNDIVRDRKFPKARAAGMALFVLCMCTAASSGQKSGEAANSTAVFSVRATHFLGFGGARRNSTGKLSIEDGVLRFQKASEPAVQVPIASVQDVLLGDESKQVGGLPMTLGKAAVPFGGGRVVSLFAHKKFDTLTLQYVANDGGIHGAIFELNKGQAKLFRDHLVAMGAHVSRNDEVNHKDGEVSNESK